MDNRDAENRLVSRGVATEVACPFCGGNQWMPALSNQTQDVGVPVFNPDTRKVGGYFDVASFACRNCGFIRLHSLQALGDSIPPHARDHLPKPNP